MKHCQTPRQACPRSSSFVVALAPTPRLSILYNDPNLQVCLPNSGAWHGIKATQFEHQQCKNINNIGPNSYDINQLQSWTRNSKLTRTPELHPAAPTTRYKCSEHVDRIAMWFAAVPGHGLGDPIDLIPYLRRRELRGQPTTNTNRRAELVDVIVNRC